MFTADAGGSVPVITMMLRILPLILIYGVTAWIAIVCLTPVMVWVFDQHYTSLANILPLGPLSLTRSLAVNDSEIFLASDRHGFHPGKPFWGVRLLWCIIENLAEARYLDAR